MITHRSDTLALDGPALLLVALAWSALAVVAVLALAVAVLVAPLLYALTPADRRVLWLDRGRAAWQEGRVLG